jgi:hypothetical protein
MPARPRMSAGTALVERYLLLCEERRLTEAAALLAPGARLVFPGGRVYLSPAEMVAGAADRYRWVRKDRERYLELGPLGETDEGGGGQAVVSLGTLSGEDLRGRPFAGVRYADVFVLRDGLIREQHVFNDLAEAGITAVATGRLGGLTNPSPVPRSARRTQPIHSVPCLPE